MYKYVIFSLKLLLFVKPGCVLYNVVINYLQNGSLLIEFMWYNFISDDYKLAAATL